MKTKTSPFKIKSPKMKKSLNTSSERQFIRGSTLNFKKKSPPRQSKAVVKSKSPKKKAVSVSFQKKNTRNTKK